MPVSGPGPYSQRTDKQPVREPGGLPYGDNKALREQQQAAPMAQAPATPTPQAIPIHAPSDRPSQPVTAGAALGAGPGTEVLTQRPTGAPAGSTLIQALQRASASDMTGTLAQLYVEAMKRGL